jgi:tetratricopeptide (TPR) repeat protein
MNRVFPTGDEPHRPRESTSPPIARDPTTVDTLLREARRLLASRSYAEAVAKLEVHRPAEWAAVDGSGVRLLRLLGQAHLGKGDLPAARDCLEHLHALEREKPNLTRDELAAALSDLCKCYRALNLPELADACLEEARRLQRGG